MTIVLVLTAFVLTIALPAVASARSGRSDDVEQPHRSLRVYGQPLSRPLSTEDAQSIALGHAVGAQVRQ